MLIEAFKKWIKVVRWPNLLIITIAQFMGAYFIIDQSWYELSRNFSFWLLVLSTNFIGGAGYIINDYFDVKIDAINKPKKVVIGKTMKRRWAILVHTILNFTGVAIGFYISISIGSVQILVSLLLWWYSASLKKKPFIGNFIVALLTGLSVFILFLLFKTSFNMLLLYASFALYISIIREVIKDMEDVRGDAYFGCKTLPIIWGIPKTKYFLYVLIIIFIISTSLLIPFMGRPVFYIFFGILILLSSILVGKLYTADQKKHYKWLSNYCKILMLIGIVSMAFL